MRRAIVGAVALAIAAVGAVTTDAHAAPAPDPVFPRGLAYAPSEDSCYTYRCVWDGRHQGNGEGHSLILTRYKGEFIAKRITHRRAHRLHALYCARPNVTCRGYDD